MYTQIHTQANLCSLADHILYAMRMCNEHDWITPLILVEQVTLRRVDFQNSYMLLISLKPICTNYKGLEDHSVIYYRFVFRCT